MKRIHIFLFTLVLLSGCSDKLLDVKNENTYTDETYFKTKAQFNEAVLATYAVFSHTGMMAREWYFIFDLLANEAERSSALVGTELQLTDYSFTNNIVVPDDFQGKSCFESNGNLAAGRRK
jgi:hypothetical protein